MSDLAIEAIRAAAIAPRPVRIEDGADDALWPSIPRYVLAWHYWRDREWRTSIREAATEAQAQSFAAAHDPRYGFDDETRPPGGPPNVYWPAIEPMLWRRALHERARQDEPFRSTLLEMGEFDALEPVDTYILETAERVALVDPSRLDTWMTPPLMAMPWIARGSIGWRMGGGESYVWDYVDWRDALSDAERELHDRAFPPDIFG